MLSTLMSTVGPVGVALAASLCVVLIFAAADSAAGQRWQHRWLDRRFESSRMPRLLDRLKIDRRHYLETVPALDLRFQLAVCRHCANRRDCDTQMALPIAAAEMTFCPNIPEVQRSLASAARITAL